MKPSAAAVCCLLIALPCKAAGVLPLPSTGTFIYSNACESQGGDFAGFRVTLTRNRGTIRTIVEFNDEGPDGRDSGRNMKFNPTDGTLGFSFHGGVGGRHSFRGVATRDILKGMFDGVAVTLPRIDKIPKELPDC